MWLKLNSEYLNLAHVVRIRFNKGWKNGQEELVAELEYFSPKGELQVFTRYRGGEARELLAIFEQQHPNPSTAHAPPTPPLSAVATNTLYDI